MNANHRKGLTMTLVAATMIIGVPAALSTVSPASAATVVKTTTTPTSTTAPLDNYGDLAAPLGGYFGANSVWDTPVAGAPLNPASAAMTANLAGQVSSQYGGIAAFNVSQYNESLITAPAGTPTTNVIFDDCQNKGYTPSSLYGPGGVFINVPIPSNAVPASGSDAGMAVYSPSTDQLWSFWKAKHQADGWHACWGGRIDSASTSPGFFPNGGGATATGLSSEGGAITIRDIESGSINHALSLAIPNPAASTNFSWPAQRSDGLSSSTSNIPEGTHFVLDPSINVAALTGLTPIARMVAVAAQKYGFFVTDTAGAVSVVTESGNAVQAATGVNPWSSLMQGVASYNIMKNFPWSNLQALPFNYGQPAAAVVTPSPTTSATPVAAVTGISPSSGPQAGGTTVTVTGTNFTNVTSIFVGNYPATSWSCSSATTCTLVTPASADANWHSVLVTTAAGTSAKVTADQFTY